MKTLSPLPSTIIEPIVRRALDEDFGNSGDIPANLLVPASAPREAGVIAGMQPAAMSFAMVDPRIKLSIKKNDGATVKKDDIIAALDGPARSLLSAERTALNFLGRMSGIASLTAQYVTAVKATKVRIVATRKTTPGLRAIEKQAVLAGGGYTHRESLAAAIMIKDNHIALAGGIDKALKAITKNADHMTRISVEVDTLVQLKKVLKYSPDVVLLDNMKPDTLTQAVSIVDNYSGARPQLEASGGVTLDSVRNLAETGIDVISIGALTHSAPNFDIGMDAA